MTSKIDYNRGCVKMSHPSSGMDVYMYKDDPGVYLDAFANVVSEAVAQACGYSI